MRLQANVRLHRECISPLDDGIRILEGVFNIPLFAFVSWPDVVRASLLSRYGALLRLLEGRFLGRNVIEHVILDLHRADGIVGMLFGVRGYAKDFVTGKEQLRAWLLDL